MIIKRCEAEKTFKATNEVFMDIKYSKETEYDKNLLFLDSRVPKMSNIIVIIVQR